ncbi:hypothetical protein H257_09381 [Aphanomyces astaci]|uniref:Uncharacterized protein n=1 Tax=Aphanomyces astaci TaxID=112090 RepID=W4GD19_APHAT|nr:hypothetical protein H257_09381 [Aphanomyces astaci]ETV76974.1 hypothetical protein H257_09381 [Aphanomyces astaci]|eukprot:XP_009833886.1 hypothetical protein H257_09381 [Aphanomyces astaci]
MASTFWVLGCAMLDQASSMTLTALRRCRAVFGISPGSTSEAWSLTDATRPSTSRPKHLLWCLMFLKVYASESVHRCLSRADEKTFRKWVWLWVDLLANLRVVLALCGIDGLNSVVPMIEHSFHWMVLTFVSGNQYRTTASGIPTNFMELGYAMKSVCACELATLSGSIEAYHAANGQIYGLHVIHNPPRGPTLEPNAAMIASGRVFMGLVGNVFNVPKVVERGYGVAIVGGTADFGTMLGEDMERDIFLGGMLPPQSWWKEPTWLSASSSLSFGSTYRQFLRWYPIRSSLPIALASPLSRKLLLMVCLVSPLFNFLKLHFGSSLFILILTTTGIWSW